MEYYFSKTINDSFENAIEKVTAALKVGRIWSTNEIDLKATVKKKADVVTQLHRCRPAIDFRLQSTLGRK
jgi:hypothetical protein